MMSGYLRRRSSGNLKILAPQHWRKLLIIQRVKYKRTFCIKYYIYNGEKKL